MLQVLCADRSEQPENLRLLAAELLAKLQADKLTGPRWTRFIVRYLPPIFADSLRDSPSSAIQMFDSTTENPELIWNDDIRQGVKQLVGQQLQELLIAQSRDISAKWNVSVQPNANSAEEPTAYNSAIANELIIGGVFIRLFNKNPGWTVRHPKQFATELMESVLELMQKPNKNLEPITEALVLLIANHPGTADQVYSLFYLIFINF
jgi:DnaJ family protein C protein 13